MVLEVLCNKCYDTIDLWEKLEDGLSGAKQTGEFIKTEEGPQRGPAKVLSTE